MVSKVYGYCMLSVVYYICHMHVKGTHQLINYLNIELHT